MGPECLDRLHHPKMEYYRHVYRNSLRWNGSERIDGKTVVVYCEQGFGDIIQFARYFAPLRERCDKVVLHCPEALRRLFAQFDADFVAKDCEDLPPHDFHTMSMSLPFLLRTEVPDKPYLSVPEKMEECDELGKLVKIGIAWEGNPDHTNNDERNCPLRHFKALQSPGHALVKVQKDIYDWELLVDAEDTDMWGYELADFYDTAKVINSIDYVVTVDTSVLHLAAAMGKPTFGLLSKTCDPRWSVGRWYDSLTLIRQNEDGDWEGVFSALAGFLKAKNLL